MTRALDVRGEREQTASVPVRDLQEAPMTASAPEDFLAFRDRRDRGLAEPHGILSQVGLHWIDPADGPS